MKEKTADIDILEKMFFDDETFEPIGYIETNFTKEQQQAIKNIIAENKELKEFKENIEKIDKKQLDKLYKDAQKALKEYRKTQNSLAELEKENKELDEENTRQHELLTKIHEKYQKDYIPKSKVEEIIHNNKPHIAQEKLQSLLGKE